MPCQSNFLGVILAVASGGDCGRVSRRLGRSSRVYTHLVFLSNEKLPEATLDDLVQQTRETSMDRSKWAKTPQEARIGAAIDGTRHLSTIAATP